MLGVCVDPEFPLCIVTEYMPDGSLDNLLASSSFELNAQVALKIGYHIASGMTVRFSPLQSVSNRFF